MSSYIRAESKKPKSTGFDGDVLLSIAHVMGVSDLSQLDMNATLMELGLDSLMGMEIKQLIEKELNVGLSMKEIQNVTPFYRSSV